MVKNAIVATLPDIGSFAVSRIDRSVNVVADLLAD